MEALMILLKSLLALAILLLILKAFRTPGCPD